MNGKSPLNVHSSPRAFARFLDGVLPAGGTTFVDLACGFGRTLLAAAETRPETRLVGNDIDESALEIAACQLFLRDRPAELDTVDLLLPEPRSEYDRVVLHPPFGLRLADAQLERRWPFGTPPPKGQSDLVWPQVAFQELAYGGYAAVVLPPTAALSRAGKARDVWARMIAKGAVEAIISLPPGNSQLNTTLPVSVLVLSASPAPRGVLMMQVPDTGAFSSKRTSTSDEKQWEAYKASIEILSAWRGGRTGTTDISIEVPREKLLGPDSVPTPQSWLAALSPLSEDRVEQTAEQVRRAVMTWEESVRAWELPPPARPLSVHAETVPPLRPPVSELALCIPRGTYVKPKEFTPQVLPVQVYTLSSLRSGRPELLPNQSARGTKRVITEPGGHFGCERWPKNSHPRVSARGVEVDRNLGLVRAEKNAWIRTSWLSSSLPITTKPCCLAPLSSV